MKSYWNTLKKFLLSIYKDFAFCFETVFRSNPAFKKKTISFNSFVIVEIMMEVVHNFDYPI